MGTTVTITDTQRGTSRTLTTDQAGAFSAPNLLPGTYTVRAEAKGFRALERQNIALEVGQDLQLDLQLQPGEVNQTITVTEAVPLIETSNAVLGGTLQSKLIESMPLNGRNFANLLQLRPDVVTPPGSSKAHSTNGLRARNNTFLVNGVNATDPWFGTSMMNTVLNAGDAGNILSVDSIDEFKTEENSPAEYGWRPGGVISIGIKSGTNAIHGTGYAYGRDTSFGARNYFNPEPNPKAPVNLEQFGGTVGGPIKKDQIFYFANYEGQRYSIGNPTTHNFPITTSLAAPGNPTGSISTSLIDACLAAAKSSTTPLTALSAELAGLSFNRATVGAANPAGNCSPIAMEAPVAGEGAPNGWLGLFPANPGPSTTVFTAVPNASGINGGLAKVDYHVNDKHTLEGMYFFSQGNNLAVGAGTSSSPVALPWLVDNYARAQTGSGIWTWIPSSAWVNDLRVGYGHYYQSYLTHDLSEDPANYNFHGATFVMPTGVTNPLYFGMPPITISGAVPASIGASMFKIVGPDSVLSIVDHVSWLRGKHAFKFGGEILANRSTENVTSNVKGSASFTSLQNFFTGTLNNSSLFTGDPVRTLSDQGYAVFLQDDWRVKPRLTMNVGVRYELTTVVKDTHGQLANFDPILGLVQVGKGISSPYAGDHNNFSPRIGFAWDIFGNGKTVLRGGGSVIYETHISFDVTNGIGNLLGLRTIPTGIPLFNAGSKTPLPVNGDITAASKSYTGADLAPITAAWRAFDPTQPIGATNGTLYANAVTNSACGDGFTLPAGYPKPPASCVIAAIDQHLRSPYVESWNIGIQRAITNNLALDVDYVGNHGVKLIGQIDINQPQPIGGFSPGWGDPSVVGTPANVCITTGNCTPNANFEQAARPFTAPCAASIVTSGSARLGPNRPGGPFNPNNSCFSFLKTVGLLNNGYSSNYNGLQTTLTGRNYHGLSFTAAYTFSHALGFASDQGAAADFGIPIDSYGDIRSQLWGNSNFDIRNRFTLSGTYDVPGRPGHAQMLEGWSLNTIVTLQSGTPWGESDVTNDFAGTGENKNGVSTIGDRWNFYGDPNDFTPVHGWTDTNCSNGSCSGGLPYFSGRTNPACVAAVNSNFSGAQQALATASLTNFGCYAVGNSVLIPPPYGSYGTTARNPWRNSPYRNWDISVAKTFKMTEHLSAQFRAEFFNVLNHPLFANPNASSGRPESTPSDPSTFPFGFAGKTPDVAASNPSLGSGGPRLMQLGLKLLF